MKKLIILTSLTLAMINLTGCGKNNKVKVTYECHGGSQSGISCSGSVTGRFNKDASLSSFNASLAHVDLSSSNVNITSANGNMQVSLKDHNGSVIASTVFAWYKSGQTLYPANPTAMTNWVNSYWQASYDIVVGVDNIQTDGDYGNNTLTAVFEYGVASMGGSDSFYLNNADMNGF